MESREPPILALHTHTETGFSIRYDQRKNPTPEEIIERQESDEAKTSTLLGFFRLVGQIENYVEYEFNGNRDADMVRTFTINKNKKLKKFF